MQARRVTRQELYELVWSKPMIHLAQVFGLSDVGLRKLCIRHETIRISTQEGKRLRRTAVFLTYFEDEIEAKHSRELHFLGDSLRRLRTQLIDGVSADEIQGDIGKLGLFDVDDFE